MATTEFLINVFVFSCLAAAVFLLLVGLYKALYQVTAMILFYFFPTWFNKISWRDEHCSEELLSEMDCPENDVPDEELETYRSEVDDKGKVKVTHRKPRKGNGTWFVLYVLMAKEKFPDPTDNMANRRSIARHLAELMEADKVTIKERSAVIPIAVEMVLVPSEAEIFAKKFKASQAVAGRHDLKSRPWWSSWWAVVEPTRDSA
uniref:Uncharacterized protein n=1 Tax=Plasmopara viticola lesion associated tombus-like virus 2 TaxID=2770119 RepID=A0A6B9Q466_9TOMB|nr:hypothetical protein [Plasmopara viticola lesion associated tombus-like virus 2]